MQELYLFLSTFGVVFFLGFQSLSVNSGHYWLAFVNSFVIGSFNLILFKTAPNIDSSAQALCYLTGGPLGIVSAMYLHRNHVSKWMARRG